MLTVEEAKRWEDFVPASVTMAAAKFFAEQERMESLRWYFIGADKILSENLDYIEKTFIQAFKSSNHEIADTLILMLKQNTSKIFNSSSYQHTIGQMGYSRNVDNFITYLKELLSEVINNKPELLRSSEKEQLDFILQFDDMNELRAAIKEKKIEEIFYKGFSDISQYFSKRLDISICESNELFDEVSLSIKKRNLIVHNRGFINKEFIDKNPNTQYKLNDLLFFDWQDISSLNMVFQKIIVPLDKIVAAKYALELYSNYPVRDERLK